MSNSWYGMAFVVRFGDSVLVKSFVNEQNPLYKKEVLSVVMA
jgi:hypothetical protein